MGTAGEAPRLIMPDHGDGDSDSEKKGSDVFSVTDSESHLPTRFAVLGDLLLIWGPNLENCGDFAKVHSGLRLQLIAACPCGYQ